MGRVLRLLLWNSVLKSGESDENASDSVDDTNHHSAGKVGLYVHIPYCRRRCRYCSFAIVPVGPKVQTEQGMGQQSQQEEPDPATQGFLEMDLGERPRLLVDGHR